MTDTGTTEAGTDVTGPPDTSSETTGVPSDACMFSQCGLTCCEADEQCVLGECRQACDSGVRCGTDLAVCCATGEVCLQPSCISPGQMCLDSYDCPDGEFCELTLQRCLPSQDPLACEIVPQFGPLELTLEWSWEANGTNAIPVVGDVTGDHVPDLVIVTRSSATPNDFRGEIVVLDGRSGDETLRVDHNPGAGRYGAYMRSTAAIADVDGNGLADIVYAGIPVVDSSGPIHAINGLGTHLWTSHNADGSTHRVDTRSGAVLATNLDDDAESEIAYGIVVIDNDGLVVSDVFRHDVYTSATSGGPFGSPPGYMGSLATAADLDTDGQMEIITGRDAFAIDWQQPAIGNPVVTVTQLWSAGGDDGYPAIADLDDDGSPEIILVTNGVVRVVNATDGTLWCGRDPTGGLCPTDSERTQPLELQSDGDGGPVGRGGPATVADFDGDGRPEIGVAAASAYAVYDFNRPGEDIVQPRGALPPVPGAIYVRWFAPTHDRTSNVTGSSVFDFQGDGAAEVLYQDECYARVYDGSTGAVLVEVASSSPTIHEYPIVADVDGDGNSEFVVMGSADTPQQCAHVPDYQVRQGVFVYGDANDRWVRTRQVWPQYTYHVTNATSNALTPLVESPNWLEPGLNNFRQNVQGAGLFHAPDLSLDISVGLQSCFDETFEIFVTVRNEGALGVPAGVAVSLWEGTDATGPLVGTRLTEAALLPGGFLQFVWLVPAPALEPKTYFATVDQAESGSGMVGECDETNNHGTTATVACPIAG